MALAGKVNYEITAPVNILADGEDTGVVFYVKSVKCKAARDWLINREREKMQEAASEEEVVSGLDMSQLPALYARCVDGWEWNGENFKKGDPVDPDFSPEYCQEIFEDDEGYFIFEQVVEGVNQLGKSKAAPRKPA